MDKSQKQYGVINGNCKRYIVEFYMNLKPKILDQILCEICESTNPWVRMVHQLQYGVFSKDGRNTEGIELWLYLKHFISYKHGKRNT